MSNTKQFVGALKRYLKSREITYKDLSGLLGVSEIAVKKAFAQNRFTLKRVDQICSSLDTTFFDILKFAENANSSTNNFLTFEQEDFLARNPNAFVIFYLVIGGIDEVAKLALRVKISPTEQVQLLNALHRLKMVRYSSGKKIETKFTQNLVWRPNGPLKKTYCREIVSDFFNCQFEEPGQFFWFKGGSISKDSLAVFQRKISKVLQEFEDLSAIDQNSKSGEKKNVTMVLAYRPWTYSLISKSLHPKKTISN